MEPLAPLTTRKNPGPKRVTKNSKLFKAIISAINEKKGENIVSLDLRKIDEAVSDFFIVCEGSSQPQVRAIAENIEHRVKENCGEYVFHKEGQNHLQWVLIDFVNVVVHVMLPEQRKFYALEEMWSDAPAERHS